MIKTFKGKTSQRIWARQKTKLPFQLWDKALLKLALIDQAFEIDDLRIPPGNRLEMLKGERAGQHSIRINNQWRICFVWDGEDAYDVEIVDYHK